MFRIIGPFQSAYLIGASVLGYLKTSLWLLLYTAWKLDWNIPSKCTVHFFKQIGCLSNIQEIGQGIVKCVDAGTAFMPS